MRRKLLNIIAILLMVLCISIAALWVRSFVRQDQVMWYGFGEGNRTSYLAASGNGRIGFLKTVRKGGPPDLPRRVMYATASPSDPFMFSGWRYGGRFGWDRMGLAGFHQTSSGSRGGFGDERW